MGKLSWIVDQIYCNNDKGPDKREARRSKGVDVTWQQEVEVIQGRDHELRNMSNL